MSANAFLDGYVSAHVNLLDIRSQGYGEDDDWDGLTEDDVLEDTTPPLSGQNGNRWNSGPNDW